MIRTLLPLLAALSIAGHVVAQEKLVNQQQGSGYSIRYPAGWRVVDAKTLSSLNGSVASAIPSTKGTSIDMMITKGIGGEGSPTLNVLVVNDEMPINDEAREILRSMPSKIAPLMRGRAENVVVRDEKFGDWAGLTVQFDISVMGKKMTQCLFSLPRAGRTYMFTCTAPRESFRSLEPTFRMMVASVEVSFMASMPRWLLFSLLGGMVTLVAAVVSKLVKTGPTPTRSQRI